MKWIFPVALFVSSLLLLAAARRVRPPQPVVAVAYHDVLLARDPVARGLERIQAGGADLLAQGSHAKRALRDQALSPDPLIAGEQSSLENGLRLKQNLYEQFLSSSMQDSVDFALRQSRSGFEDFARERYRAMLTDFDRALAALESETLIEPLRDERRRLFNLRLKLDSLTRDHIVFSTARLEDLESQVRTLNGIIASKKRLGRRAFDIKEKRMYENLIDGKTAELDAYTRDLQQQVQTQIDGLDRSVAVMMSGYNTDAKRTRSQALERRNRLRRTMEQVRAPSPDPFAAITPAEDARRQYQDLFLDTLRARALAVANDHNAFLVLDSPLYHAGNVVDITEDLGQSLPHGGSR